jgi:hypothetical protein
MLAPSTVVPVQPILLEWQHGHEMLADLKQKHHWILEPYCYTFPECLIANLGERVIGPAEAKAHELRAA